ncbi:MAG: hypothetical protein J1F28_00150 [Oscillospiraceae bacterium]|nr:hypothetical protein [Oscillospiraceae bacterium]
MSFKDDYKSALGSVSPDTDKIIAEVHNKLNENAPVMIRAERKKKPVWAIIGSAAGAAACVAIAVFVAVRIAPSFLRDNLSANGVSPENYSINAEAEADGTAGVAGYGSADISNDKDENANKSGISESSAVLEDSGNSSPGSESKNIDLGNGLTLVSGTLRDRSELEEFSIEPYIHYYFTDGLADEDEEFLDSLGNPDIKVLYQKGEALFTLLTSTGDVIAPGFISKEKEDDRPPARITISDGEEYAGSYYETRYTYDSFCNAYLSTFTEEAAKELFREYDFFLDYNDALLCSAVAGGGNIWTGTIVEVRREYELISESDTEVVFRRTVLSRDMDFRPAAEYIPELRDKYEITYIDFKFVLTEDGWRVADIPAEYEAAADSISSGSRTLLEVGASDISSAREIHINELRYLSSGETVSFDDISGDIMRMSDIDGRWFNIVFDDNRAYVSDEEWWKKGQMICFYRE